MEIWKPLRNFPGYEGSTEGRIINVRTQRILKTHLDERGREKVCLRRNNQQYTVSVAQVMANTFLGEQSGMDVWHKDRDRSNNRPHNLEWCTRQEIIARSFEEDDRSGNHRTPVMICETGEVFGTVRACADAIGSHPSEIFKCLAGTLPHVKGYHFERV